MAIFKSGSALNAQLEALIKNADEFLWLISPYIKLHSRIKAELKLKKSNPALKIIVVFGKAEDGANKLSYEDASFLKEFSNIEIRYEKNLHAKYYASEDGGLITSMNLYDFSQNNNIECGVWMEAPHAILGRVPGMSKDKNVDAESYKCFAEVIENSELLFSKEAEFEMSFMGLQKTYTQSTVKLDILFPYLKLEEKKPDRSTLVKSVVRNEGFRSSTYSQKVKTTEIQTRVYSPSKASYIAVSSRLQENGYCIRTGVEIPFNLKRPYCPNSYSIWARFGNADYPEKYCHKSGNSSNGKTSFNNPVL